MTQSLGHRPGRRPVKRLTQAALWVSVVLCVSIFAEAQMPVPAPQSATAGSERVPAPLSVKYEKGLLTIVAENSSLGEILDAVHSQTGAATEFPASASNERATVRLGPAPLATVLAALLLGSPFDYVIFGSGDEPGSLQILLSEKTAAPSVADTPTLAVAPASAPPLASTSVASTSLPSTSVDPVPAHGIAEVSPAGQPVLGGSNESVQFMTNQPAVASAAGDILYTPETSEPSPDAPPRQVRPSKEGPRIPPPGKGQTVYRP